MPGVATVWELVTMTTRVAAGGPTRPDMSGVAAASDSPILPGIRPPRNFPRILLLSGGATFLG